MSNIDRKKPRPELKPIDTIFEGIRYRSRLEAKWKVAFNALGVEAKYEQQGFEIDGKPYLPDFYLPERCMWAEVKPDLETSDLSKPIGLARLTQEPVAILGDIPYENSKGPHHLLIRHDRAGNLTATWFAWLVTSPDIGGVIEEPHGFSMLFHGTEMPDMWRMRLSRVEVQTEVAAAYREARAPRFEHGEKPRNIWRGDDYTNSNWDVS